MAIVGSMSSIEATGQTPPMNVGISGPMGKGNSRTQIISGPIGNRELNPQKATPKPVIEPIPTKAPTPSPNPILTEAGKIGSGILSGIENIGKSLILKGLSFSLSAVTNPVGTAKEATLGQLPKNLPQVQLPNVSLPKLEAPKFDPMSIVNTLRKQTIDSPDFKVLGGVADILKGFIKENGVSQVSNPNLDLKKPTDALFGSAYVRDPNAKWNPKTGGEKIGAFVSNLINDIGTANATGVAQGIESATNAAGMALKTNPITSSIIAGATDKLSFIKNTVAELTGGKIQSFLNKLQPIPITFEDLSAVTKGTATSEQRALFDKAVATGISPKQLIKDFENYGTSPATKLYDFVKNAIDTITGTLKSSLPEGEQKLLGTGAKSELAQIIGTGEHTSEELMAKVLDNKLQNTPEGKEIIKLVAQAQAEGKNIVVNSAENAALTSSTNPQISATEPPPSPTGVVGEPNPIHQKLEDIKAMTTPDDHVLNPIIDQISDTIKANDLQDKVTPNTSGQIAENSPELKAAQEPGQGPTNIESSKGNGIDTRGESKSPSSPKPASEISGSTGNGPSINADLGKAPTPPIYHEGDLQSAASGIDPGVGKFVKGDLKNVVNGLKESGKELRDIVNPSSATTQSRSASLKLREAQAELANAASIEMSKYKKAADYFENFNDVENIKNNSSYERTGEFEKAPEGYSKFNKDSTDAAYKIIQEVRGEDTVGYVDNFIRRAYEFESKIDELKGTTYLTNKLRSLSENKSTYKSRTLNMPLEEALKNMRDRGIKVKMVTTNPELLRQWVVNNARRALVYSKVWEASKDSGLLEFVREGSQIPEGMVKLQDRAAEVFYPKDKGFQKSGSYYATPDVARIFNNVISSGLDQSPTYKGLRAIENTMNQFQLGLSGFHLTGTAINAGVSDWALGMRNILEGKPIEAATKFVRGSVPFASFARDVWRGNNLLEGLKNNSPEAYAFLKDVLNPAGGRIGLDARYRTTAWDSLQKAYTEGNIIGSVVRLPKATLEVVAKPLMEYAVPRAKIGAFMDLSSNAVGRLGTNASKEMVARTQAESWDSIDNRFGQLVYDNLFWNKSLKDTALFATRSVGWNLGTVRELGGGSLDLLTKTSRGKGFTDRTLYSMALPLYVGLMGAIYMYLHTGHGPEELKDYFYPKNGLKDKNGNDDRASMPSYMKDVFAYTQDPFGTILHKTAPLISTVNDLITNKNYYGDLIANRNDPIQKQAEQTGAYLINNILPFSMQQLFQQQVEGSSVEQKVESFFGFTKAPGKIVQSKQQLEAQKAYENIHGLRGSQTPEQVDIGKLKSRARDDIKAGVDINSSKAFQELIKNGTLNTSQKRSNFVKSAKLTSTQRLIKSLPKSTRATLTP